MAPKGPAIAKELRGQVHEYAGKLQQFGGGLDQQLTDALPHMTHLLQEEAAAAVSQVRVTNEAALNQLDAQAATARQHLDAEQQHALARVDAVRASSIRHLSTLAHQAQATLETAAQSRCSELDAHLQAVTSQLLAAESPDPQAVDEAVANASIYLAAGVADFDAQADRATTATRLGLEQAAAGTATVLTTVATNVATQDQRAVSGVLGQARASGQAAVAAAQQIVAALALHQQAIVAEGLAGIDELIAKGLAEPARLNEESRSNAGRTATEAIAKAREPLAALPANVKAAADKAKAEHERSLFAKIATGIGKALLGIVVGLVIVIALALVVAFIAGFFGVALTAFGAMMIAGGILLLAGAIFAFYKRHTDPETAKLGIGAQIKFALADVTGVTALCEGIFNQDVVTGKELNLDAEQRSERVTTGTLSIVMLILGARGLKAAPYTRPIGLPAFSFSSGLAGARGVGAEMWSTGLLAAKAGKEWFASAFKRLTAPRPIPADAVPLARPIKPGDVVTPDRITAGGPDTGAPATDSAKDAVPDKDPAGAGKSAPKSTAELAKSVRDAAKARGDPVGLKKAEYIERASSKLLTDNLKADFFARVKAKLDADPAKLPWDAMKDVVAENPTAFLYKGDVIPPDVIEQHGGMARGVDVDSVWSHMLKDEVKAPYRAHAQAEVSGGRDATAGDIFDELDARAKALWLDELRKDPSIFDLGKCKPNAVLTNPKAPGWWIPRDEFGQFSLVELIVDMALKADVYRPGMIVFTVDAGATGAASFHLPTPLDGIAFGEWGEAPPSSVFGVTEGGLPEAVAPPKIDVSMVKPGNIQVFPPSGPIAAPAAVGAGGSADAVQDVLGNRKPAGVR
ncbi:MAG: hypothetical protein E6I88_05670 [Chloroflexi bacterium]|nr:MAG: hypothetical protein E6I88_05670 [Chloroflexota bacterium]